MTKHENPAAPSLDQTQRIDTAAMASALVAHERTVNASAPSEVTAQSPEPVAVQPQENVTERNITESPANIPAPEIPRPTASPEVVAVTESEVVPASRWGNFVDAIKLRTVDKWSYAFSRMKAHLSQDRDTRTVLQNEYDKEVTSRRLALLEQSTAEEKAKFDAILAGMQTPEVKELLLKHRDTRVSALQAQAQPYRERLAQHDKTIDELKAKKANFAEKIVAIEDKYNQRIDQRIQSIKTEIGYDKEATRNATLRQQKEQSDAIVDNHRKVIADLNVALKQKGIYSKAEIAEMRAQVKEMTEALNEEYLPNRKLHTEKLKVSDAKMAAMNKRFAKWEKMRPRNAEASSDSESQPRPQSTPSSEARSESESGNETMSDQEAAINATRQLAARIDMFIANVKQFSPEDWSNALQDMQKGIVTLKRYDGTSELIVLLEKKLQGKELKYLSGVTSALKRNFELTSMRKLVERYAKEIAL